MMLPTEGEWFTVSEGARWLGLTPGALRMAVKRGRLSVHRAHKRLNLVSMQELERYRQEHLGKGSWPHRHDPIYEPSRTALAMRRYRKRKRAREQAQQPTDPPAQEGG